MSRRDFLLGGGLAALANARPKLAVTGVELIPVRATARTVWLFARVATDRGLRGLGEASDAFGFTNTTKEQAARMESELRRFAALCTGKSPLEIERYRQAGEPLARQGGLPSCTAFSAIEQALWDLAGQALDLPVHALLGGGTRASLPLYANINRATTRRTPDGFADTARRAVAEGFRSIKAAPFDGFPKPGSPAAEIRKALDLGADCVAAMRAAVGPDVRVMIDCHSFFDVPMSIEMAKRLEPHGLEWYEEPVAPERVDDTLAIRKGIRQKMAGGEMLFGVSGFTPLCRVRAVHTIMPDVKHCGGLLEMTRIAAMAKAENVGVAPHNPSGPVATAASAQVCAVIPNCDILELQWGEVDWRTELLSPAERIERGTIAVADRPGLGVALNDRLARAHAL